MKQEGSKYNGNLSKISFNKFKLSQNNKMITKIMKVRLLERKSIRLNCKVKNNSQLLSLRTTKKNLKRKNQYKEI